PPKADIRFAWSRCPFSATSGCEQLQQGSPLFDQLVGAGEEQRRQLEAERPRGLQVDHQVDFSRLLDGKIAGPCALEDLVDQAGGTAVQVGVADEGGRQPPGVDEPAARMYVA